MATGSATAALLPSYDQRVLLNDVSWADFERILEVYRGLEIGEVWIWREGSIEVHVFVDGRYEQPTRSAVLPDLDLPELARHIDPENQTEAVRRYRQTLRAR